MKKLFIMLAIVMISSFTMAQEVSEKVEAAFSPEEIQELQQDPEQLEYWNFYADNVFVYNVDAKNWQDFDDISTLQPKSDNTPVLTTENFDPETFNPLLYDIELEDKEIQYFKIGDTGEVLMIYSHLRFDVLFDRHMSANE